MISAVKRGGITVILNENSKRQNLCAVSFQDKKRLLGDTAKLYQAGARAPLWIAQRGEVLELAAEGLALGLDDGAVFDKALRPQEIEMSPGTRLLVFNEGMLWMDGILERIEQHSSRHTAMFMNMVLGGIEQDAGDGGLREDAVLLTAKLAGSR